MQETFLRIWEKRSDLLDNDTIRYYLFTAVRNNCLTHHQLTKRADHLRNSLRIIPAENFVPGDAHQDLADQRAIIEDALAQLPPKCKDVFLLSRLGNLTYKEIARSLNISVKTVENQMGKALKMMRAFLKDDKLFHILMIIGFIFFSQAIP